MFLRPVLTKARSLHRCFSTVDASEIKKFSEKAAEWWDPDGEFGMLQIMNPARVSYVRKQLGVDPESSKPFQGLNMLDIGCGGGFLSESLTRLGANVVGADASSDNIKTAQVHARQDPRLWRGPGKLEYRNTTAEELVKEKKEAFDAVMAMEIIEHVSNPMQFLHTCADLVKPGGHLFMSTMSRTVTSYLLTVFLAEDILRLVHRGTHDWSKYITTRELKSGVESLGAEWSVQDVRGIYWDPLKRKWWISDTSDATPCGIESFEVNYFLTAKKH